MLQVSARVSGTLLAAAAFLLHVSCAHMQSPALECIRGATSTVNLFAGVQAACTAVVCMALLLRSFGLPLVLPSENSAAITSVFEGRSVRRQLVAMAASKAIIFACFLFLAAAMSVSARMEPAGGRKALCVPQGQDTEQRQRQDPD